MEDYSQDELEAPGWLNQEFLKKVLQNYNKTDNIKINKYEVTPAVTKGNHFASIMFRTNVDYSENEIDKNESFIIKAKPEKNGKLKELLDQCESDLFETEIQMFSKTLPYFEKILNDYDINVQFGAKMLYNENTKLLVLQDLKKLNYKLFWGDLLTFDDYKLVMNKLAKWHAVSYKIFHEIDYKCFQFYENRGLMTSTNVHNNPIFTSGIQYVYGMLNNMSDIDKIYATKYANVKDVILKECIRLCSNPNGKFNVLNHGDFHLRNMVFKSDNDDNVDDVLFVDFQISVWGSPAIDIIYSLYMIAEPEIRQNRRDEAIYFYYNAFVDTLKTLKFSKSIPTFEDLQDEINKMKKFELFIFVSFLPYIHQMATGKKFDADDLYEEGDMKKKIFESPEYVNDMKKMLPYYLHNGYFFNYIK